MSPGSRSRGAIATGAIGLHDDATSSLFAAFVPYSHLDGDCGWADDVGNTSAIQSRYARLHGRPILSIAECDVAIAGDVHLFRGRGAFQDQPFGF